MAEPQKSAVTEDELLHWHSVIKPMIHARLKDFDNVRFRNSDRELFQELAFCLMTPGTKAVNAHATVQELDRRGLLWRGNVKRVASVMKGKVRFHNNKARYLVAARERFAKPEGLARLLSQFRSNQDAREWLATNVKGLGWKEASHFLRNVGRGEGLAIVDTHILKNLRGLGLVQDRFYPSSRKLYMQAEGKVLRLAKRLKIPETELDMLIWSRETGAVFK
ncbi:MAG TPA: hypothetical protein VGQ00_02855 [Candidatus Norongarragalinales archaeon]|jgi:N-glycosylase/DNA lyase|nr:hypothetical protein [Candidatus Norongarragalinales archaeon]